MKHCHLFLAIVLCASLTSCFKDEPLNAECDIEQAYIHTDTPKSLFYQLSDTLVNVLSSENKIRFHVRMDADRTHLSPLFRLTDGATISPENGSEHDFSNGSVAYTVTSQDGQWHRNYEVSVDLKQRTVDELAGFGFERYYLEPDQQQYYVWNDTTLDGYVLDDWATGNPGFALSLGSAKPDEYPTTPYEQGMNGKAVKLTTRSTGPLGELVNMRLAAGNLFLGKFDVSKSLTSTMQATRFGIPVAQKPVCFMGVYQYSPGKVFQGRDGKPVEGRTDTGNIYAILYKNTDENGKSVVLSGDNVMTSPLIVAKAIINKVEVTSEWTPFQIPFTYLEDIDRDRLAAYGYNLAIVFTSSDRGANFEGAIGSTMLVDNVKILWENQIIKD